MTDRIIYSLLQFFKIYNMYSDKNTPEGMYRDLWFINILDAYTIKWLYVPQLLLMAYVVIYKVAQLGKSWIHEWNSTTYISKHDSLNH